MQRAATLDAAVSQLRQAQEKVAGQQDNLDRKTQELETREGALVEKEGVVEGRLKQLVEAQERLDLERQALRERTQALTEAELARETLQEQLRKRSEELAARQKSFNEKMQEHEAQAAGIVARKAEFERQAQEAQAQLEAARQEHAARAETLQMQETALEAREAHRREQYEQLRNLGRDIAGERKALGDERARCASNKKPGLTPRPASRRNSTRCARKHSRLPVNFPTSNYVRAPASNG